MQLDINTILSAPKNVPATPSQSPSKNPCKVRVRPGNYRNDPYGARVLAPAIPIHSRQPLPALEHRPAVATPRQNEVQQEATPVEPSSRPRPSRASHFVTRMYENVARAHDLPPMQPTQPQPPSSNPSSTSRRMSGGSHESSGSSSSNPRRTASRPPSVTATPSPPPETSAPDAQPVYAYIRFKHETCCFMAPFHVEAGQRVIVEGDRGEHMGFVERVTDAVPQYPVPCTLLRIADDEEVFTQGQLRAREAEMSQMAGELAAYYRLPIRIVDTEFQFDCQKLTVYFMADQFVDFRKLQRALFRECNCRIWLVNWKEVHHH